MSSFRHFFYFFTLSLRHFWQVTYKLKLQNIVQTFFFNADCPSFYRNSICQKIKEQNKTLTSCLPLNPAQGNKSQSLLEFLDFMLIFLTSDGQFLAYAAKSHSRKINPEVHSLKFASFFSPMVSHLDSCHLSYPYRPPKGSTPSPLLLTLCPLCSISAGRKNSAAQTWLSSSRTTTQSRPICHCMLGNSVVNSKWGYCPN